MIKAEWTNKDSLDLQPTCNQLATTEDDPINRADAIKCIRWGDGVTDVIERIKSLPSAEPKHGKWLYKESGHGKCSECEAWVFELYPFCPNCGADMRGEKHE